MSRTWLALAALGVGLAGCTPPPTEAPDSKSGLKNKLLGEWVVIETDGKPLPQDEADDLLLFRTDDTARFGQGRMTYRVLDDRRIELVQRRFGTETTMEANVEIAGDILTLTVKPQGEKEVRVRAARYGSTAAKTAVAKRKPFPTVRGYATAIAVPRTAVRTAPAVPRP
jgi:hypothetical protein